MFSSRPMKHFSSSMISVAATARRVARVIDSWIASISAIDPSSVAASSLPAGVCASMSSSARRYCGNRCSGRESSDSRSPLRSSRSSAHDC